MAPVAQGNPGSLPAHGQVATPGQVPAAKGLERGAATPVSAHAPSPLPAEAAFPAFAIAAPTGHGSGSASPPVLPQEEKPVPPGAMPAAGSDPLPQQKTGVATDPAALHAENGAAIPSADGSRTESELAKPSVRSRRAASVAHAAAAPPREAPAQPGSAETAGAGMVRLAAPDRGGSEPRHAGAGAEGLTAGAGSVNAFAALDAGSARSDPAWIHAGAQRAEAGFNDPDLGWVGVRADLAGGSVHAAVLSGSAEAAQALGGHLAGLSAHLAEHHIEVGSVSMAAPARQDLGAGAGGFQQGTAQQQGQGTGGQSPGSESRLEHGAQAGSGAAPIHAGGEPGHVAAAGPAFGQATASGRHISVMA